MPRGPGDARRPRNRRSATIDIARAPTAPSVRAEIAHRPGLRRTRPMKSTALAAIAACLSLSAHADPVSILFVGNSYTFGRVDPVLSYNAANVHDLTAAFNAVNPSGTNSYPVGTAGQGWFEPHPWGGVPGIFKQFTVESGLAYDVSLSTRNAATLRGQFLNTANSAWDLRGNVASKSWDTVVLQEQS